MGQKNLKGIQTMAVTALFAAFTASCAETFQCGLEPRVTDSCIEFRSDCGNRDFLIYGYMGKIDGSVTPVFNAIPAYTDEELKINYAGDKHWDLSASEYRFYAYACGDEELQFDINRYSESITFKNLEQKKHLDCPTLYTDLNVHSPQDGISSPVNFSFKTPYTLLNIVLKQESSDNSDIVVEDIHFGPVINYMFTKGDVIVSHHRTYTSVRIDAENAETASFIDFGNVSLADRKPAQELSLNVLPHGNQGRYKLTATVNGNQVTAFVPSQVMDWEPNMAYTYVFNVTDNTILFQYMDDNTREFQ